MRCATCGNRLIDIARRPGDHSRREMASPRLLVALPIAWFLAGPGAAMARGSQGGTPEPSPPTAIEQALIEYVCSAARAPGALATDTYEQCLRAKLLSLRADFGRDLGRLSAADRRALDSACNKIREMQGREAYVGCVNDQLVSLRNRRSRGKPAAADAAATASPSASNPSPTVEPPAPSSSSGFSGIWIGASLAGLFVAGGAWLVVKGRRPSARCRTCGTKMTEAGDLCQKCRHEAAEALRRAAAERAEHERAQVEEPRRLREQAEEQQREKARQEEEARLRFEEQERQREAAERQRQDELRQREEESRRLAQMSDASQATFDPHMVLGVPRDASQDVIEAAYHEARLKYDLDQVSHLGPELQEHYKKKAQAVDRAFEMLTEKPDTST